MFHLLRQISIFQLDSNLICYSTIHNESVMWAAKLRSGLNFNISVGQGLIRILANTMTPAMWAAKCVLVLDDYKFNISLGT